MKSGKKTKTGAKAAGKKTPPKRKGVPKRRTKKDEAGLKKYKVAIQYIREKVDQLLTVMGTSPLKPEELDDRTLIELDPIGIISDSFVQVLDHLHKTNEKLSIINEEIEAIFDSAGAGILVIDREMRILAYNKELKKQFFAGGADVTDQLCYKMICRVEDPGENCPFRKIFKTGKSVHQNVWMVRGRYYNTIGAPIRSGSGEISRIILVYLDVTDRVHADNALRNSEEKYRDLFENANDLIQSVAPDGSILYVNRAWREALEYSEDEIPALSVFDVIHPKCDDCGTEFKSVVYGEKTGRVETTFITKSGKEMIVEGNINTVVEDGKVVGTRGIFRDISERKRAEQVIASEREQLSVTLRSIGDGVITTDTEERVVLVNKVAEKLTGWAQGEAAGRPIGDVFRLRHETTRVPCASPVRDVLKRGKPSELANNTVLVARDGTERIISDSVAPIMDKDSAIIGTVLVFRDITEKRRLEEKILKSEKIESLGVLAGGIAHDFNNLLNAIIGNVELAMMSLGPEDSTYKNLTRAEKAALRASDLTTQLLTFSRGGAPIKKAASIIELIRDSADFALRGSKVRPEFSLPETLWNVEFDEGQISQVINNLVINAVQAMPEGGLINISAENITIGPSEILKLKDGKYVKITIKDDGIGIPGEHIQRIFEPYFTTKPAGSGLGLATCYSIIKNHDGLIDVESVPGSGAAFYIYLPAFLGKIEEKVHGETKPLPEPGRGKILIMDDEELIRVTVGEMLRQTGYEVALAAEGNEAVRKYGEAKKAGVPFSAVIMDLTIPGGVGGKEAIKKLLKIDPEVKVIVSSGYSSDAIMANYRQYGFAGVLVKPYKKGDLIEVLHKVISPQAG